LPRACRQKSSPPRQSPGVHHASRRRADGCAGCFLGTFERVIASGNHLLTQVKDNQPTLRRKLELGAVGRKSTGRAKSENRGRNRWETRELTVFPAKAWFRHTPWEKLIKTVLRLERTVCKRDPNTGLCVTTTETVFWVSSAQGIAPQ